MMSSNDTDSEVFSELSCTLREKEVEVCTKLDELIDQTIKENSIAPLYDVGTICKTVIHKVLQPREEIASLSDNFIKLDIGSNILTKVSSLRFECADKSFDQAINEALEVEKYHKLAMRIRARTALEERRKQFFLRQAQKRILESINIPDEEEDEVVGEKRNEEVHQDEPLPAAIPEVYEESYSATFAVVPVLDNLQEESLRPFIGDETVVQEQMRAASLSPYMPQIDVQKTQLLEINAQQEDVSLRPSLVLPQHESTRLQPLLDMSMMPMPVLSEIADQINVEIDEQDVTGQQVVPAVDPVEDILLTGNLPELRDVPPKPKRGRAARGLIIDNEIKIPDYAKRAVELNKKTFVWKPVDFDGVSQTIEAMSQNFLMNNPGCGRNQFLASKKPTAERSEIIRRLFKRHLKTNQEAEVDRIIPPPTAEVTVNDVVMPRIPSTSGEQIQEDKEALRGVRMSRGKIVEVTELGKGGERIETHVEQVQEKSAAQVDVSVRDEQVRKPTGEDLEMAEKLTAPQKDLGEKSGELGAQDVAAEIDKARKEIPIASDGAEVVGTKALVEETDRTLPDITEKTDLERSGIEMLDRTGQIAGMIDMDQLIRAHVEGEFLLPGLTTEKITNVPSTVITPDIAHPEIIPPPTVRPEVTGPEVIHPEVPQAEVIRPEVPQAGLIRPEVPQAEVIRPEVPQAGLIHPEVPQPEVVGPEIIHPEVSGQPTGKVPGVENMDTERPITPPPKDPPSKLYKNVNYVYTKVKKYWEEHGEQPVTLPEILQEDMSKTNYLRLLITLDKLSVDHKILLKATGDEVTIMPFAPPFVSEQLMFLKNQKPTFYRP